MAERRYEKILVIGLDGADWRLLDPWMVNGELPAIATLVDEGARSTLRSTIRPESSVAWTSFATGMNPGKHGVFGFAGRQRPDRYAFTLTNASTVHVPRFWDLLGAHDYRVGLLNVPYTYPPKQVNGFLVAGMLTPSVESEFTYPSALKQALLRDFGTYITDVSGPNDDKGRLIENVRTYTRQQRDMALYLMERRLWDVFVVAFTGPDRLQHFLWADADPTHPLHHDGSFASALLEHYRSLDTAIARMLERVPAETLVLLISDHGFNGCARKFYVNHWLHHIGLLAVQPPSGVWARSLSLANRLGQIDIVHRLKRMLPGSDAVTLSDWRSKTFATMIDWTQTKVYFGLDGGLRVNLRGRESTGIVDPGAEYAALCRELTERLHGVTDPHTGNPAISFVFMRDELYHGPRIDMAPDVIVEPQREHRDATNNVILDGTIRPDVSPIFGSSEPYTANHALDGIFCAWGPGIRRGNYAHGATILDVGPTILAAAGVPIPDQMDGSVLDIFADRPDVLHARADAADTPPHSTYVYDAEEEQMIERRLRDLGYL